MKLESNALPSLDPIPEDIEEQIRRLLQTPSEPVLEAWLLELIKNSGHMSLGGDMRWRVLSMVWLAAEFDTDKAWPYLMWLNMNEPRIGDHLSEILIEALNDYDGHLQLANWLANPRDERLTTFFGNFPNIPALRKLPSLFNKLLARPSASQTGVWLAAFCRDTAQDPAPQLRHWHLLAAVWYATCFNAQEGLTYLRAFTDGVQTLSPADNKALMETAAEINGVTAMHQWIAACPDETIRAMLQEFGHYDLSEFAESTLLESPDYGHLAQLTDQAAGEAQTFKQTIRLLAEAGLPPKKGALLDLACGPLAPQTVLLNSAGYKTVGVDLYPPPEYLPLPNLKFWPKRNKHVKAWKSATGSFYESLARQADLKLKWNKVNIELANLTRLQFDGGTFAAVICLNYLEQAPFVAGLLAEAARVLLPGGLLLANIRPYATLSGAFQPADSFGPWGHLREQHDTWLPLNRWREAQYRAAFEAHFSIEQWLAERDEQAQARLSPEIRAELSDYSEEELTRKQLIILCRKKS